MITFPGIVVERAITASMILSRTLSTVTIPRPAIYTASLAALLVVLPAVRSVAQTSTITVSGLPTSVVRYAKLEATVPVFTTSATNFYWPYDSQIPSGDTTGLTVGTGVTVNALFLPPGTTNWAQAKVQPCFWYQPMRTVTINSQSVPSPSGTAGWRLRFAPDIAGIWQLRVQVTDATGVRQSSIYSFRVTSSTAKGFIRVSSTDSRYFEFANGTPFISGAGISERDPAKFSLLAGAYKLNRVWWQGSDPGQNAPFGLSGQGGARDWSVQGTFTGPPTVSAPANHLILKALSAGELTTVSVAPGISGKTYQWRALVKTVGVTGPATTNGSLGSTYGPTLFCTDNAAGGDTPINTQQVTGTTDWTWISGTFTLNFPSGEFRWMKMGIPNATSGTCYIAETSVREVLTGGTFGPELAIHPMPNPMQSYSQEDAYNCDQQVTAAATNDLYLKVVCFEKQDVATAAIQPDGTFGQTDDNNSYGVTDVNTVNAQRWYQRAAMRYFAARWGWSPNIHSVEFLNEGDPFNGNHYNGANAFANYIHQINVRPILATTSFWHSLPAFWNTTSCDYLDVHKYIGPQSGDPSLQDGYGMWNQIPTETDTVRGNVLKAESDNVGLGPQVYLSPIPVTPGHTYRVKYALKGVGLSKTNPQTGETSPYSAGPGITVRVYTGHTNAPSITSWGPGTVSPEGNFDWEERQTDLLPMSDPEARFITIDAETHWTYGKALFDDFRLEDVTNPNNPIAIPVPNGTFDACTAIKFDTALQSVDAWQQYVGGGGIVPRAYNKPLVWGEYGISGDALYGSPYLGFSYTGEEQKLYQDTTGVSLHKLIWAGIAPGGVIPILWWNKAVYQYNLFDSAKAYQTFLSGITLTNGRYVDAQPICTGGLRAWGQKDLTAKRAHIWIDNPDHTWGNVVNGVTIPAKTGTIGVDGFTPNTNYTVQFWNTRTGLVTSSQSSTANSSGVLTVSVTNLATDMAVKIF